MNRLDFLFPPSNGLPFFCTLNASARTASCDPSLDTLSGDLLEEPAAGWENAWIDLGGEG
jgi:hypothetical protein